MREKQPKQTTVNPADVIADLAGIDPEDETLQQYRKHAGESIAEQTTGAGVTRTSHVDGEGSASLSREEEAVHGPSSSLQTTDRDHEEFLARARILATERDCPNYIGGRFVFCLNHGACKCMEDAHGER